MATTTKKKTAAQLRRLQKRAEQRGEEYVEPEPPETDNKSDHNEETASHGEGPVHNDDEKNSSTAKDENDPEAAVRLAAAEKLTSELQAIENNEELKSKDRRSAKRKAEAIAQETTGMTTVELLKWLQEHHEKQQKHQGGNENKTQDSQHSRKSDPYIAFFGQLSFETTKDDLLQHIRSQLKESYPPSSKKSIQIRMLTDSKTSKSRGMAFVQVDDPEFLYALLKLHQTYLKGRRLNVEKSAGGKKGSETRQVKLQTYRKEQEAYFAEVVDNILGEFRKTGELRDDELDEGVIAMCKRHCGPVVRAAVTEYVEKQGNQMDNPSAYLTFLVSKFAKEGIHDEEPTGVTKKDKPNNKRTKRKEVSSNSHDMGDNTSTNKRPKSDGWQGSSQMANAGVDMSMSDNKNAKGGNKGIFKTSGLSKIFPSSQRGNGRGYMRNVRR